MSELIPLRTLGKTGERISLIGLGGAHIARPRSRRASVRFIRKAIDSGINFMDNCWDYHQGRSEMWMGEALTGGYRERVFLMTKIDGRTRASAAAQIDQSLKRLRTETIDLMQIHEVIRWDDPDRVFAPGGAIEALDEARRQGKIRYIGFTGHKDPEIHLKMLAQGFQWDAVQMPLNLLDAHYKSFQQKVLPVLLERGIGVLAMKPLAGGDIFDTGAVNGSEALAYVMSLPVDVVINGMESEADLEQALSAARTFAAMSVEKRRQLKEQLENRMAAIARDGEFERYKNQHVYDGTFFKPHWLEEARL